MTLTKILTAFLVAFSLTVFDATASLISIDFNDVGGPHWTGIVDTTADTLTIQTWTNNAGLNWTPANLPLLPSWLAQDASGNSFDVPDTFDGTIDSTFAFVSPVANSAIAWNEGTSNQSTFFPGWGGFDFVIKRRDLNETGFALPSNANDSGVVYADSVTATAVPEPSSFALLGMGAIGLIGYRRWKRKQAA